MPCATRKLRPTAGAGTCAAFSMVLPAAATAFGAARLGAAKAATAQKTGTPPVRHGLATTTTEIRADTPSSEVQSWSKRAAGLRAC